MFCSNTILSHSYCGFIFIIVIADVPGVARLLQLVHLAQCFMYSSNPGPCPYPLRVDRLGYGVGCRKPPHKSEYGDLVWCFLQRPGGGILAEPNTWAWFARAFSACYLALLSATLFSMLRRGREGFGASFRIAGN